MVVRQKATATILLGLLTAMMRCPTFGAVWVGPFRPDFKVPTHIALGASGQWPVIQTKLKECFTDSITRGARDVFQQIKRRPRVGNTGLCLSVWKQDLSEIFASDHGSISIQTNLARYRLVVNLKYKHVCNCDKEVPVTHW